MAVMTAGRVPAASGEAKARFDPFGQRRRAAEAVKLMRNTIKKTRLRA
jgi:hypothetical protein